MTHILMSAFTIIKVDSLIPNQTQSHSNRQARFRENSGIAPEATIGGPIARGATEKVRIIAVKMQGSLRDIREA